MAFRGSSFTRERLYCAICQNLMKDPVTIPCGHNYCMDCINRHWDGEDQKHIYSCPQQCRQMFLPRPDLKKNTMLAELVEEMKKTDLQPSPAHHCYARPGDVSCDSSIENKLQAIKLSGPELKKNTVSAELVEEVKKTGDESGAEDIYFTGHGQVSSDFYTERMRNAVKSCLQSLVSDFEQQLQPHYQSPAFENHNVVDSFKKLQENICFRHNEVLKIFCSFCQKCICFLCTFDDHRGHAAVPASEERAKKQTALQVVCEKIQQRIQDRETDVEVLQEEVEAINQSADTAVRDIDRFTKDLIYLIKEKSWDVKQQIRSQQETEVNRANDLVENFQKEITELERKDAQLEQLCNTEDDCQFLQMFPKLSGHSPTKQPRPTPRHLQYFDDVTAALSELNDKLQRILCEELPKLSQRVTEVDVLLTQMEPVIREDFLQHSYQITLDPNTANAHMLLSEGNRKATYTSKKQSYPSHRDRFTSKSQVLSREALTGRHYWEVEWSGSGIIVAVTYKDISRKGDNSEFGSNDKSWAFRCSPKKYKIRHNSVSNPISGPLSSRVGIYLDHRAGILSFYSVSDSMTLLHTVQTTFSQPLHVGLLAYYYIGSESAAVFSNLVYSVC